MTALECYHPWSCERCARRGRACGTHNTSQPGHERCTGTGHEPRYAPSSQAGLASFTPAESASCERLGPEVGHEAEGYSCSTHNMPWDECPHRQSGREL